jgi:hypothetical protein
MATPRLIEANLLCAPIMLANGFKADPSMSSRFPEPWPIVELPTGFAVEDATGKQIGVFYGRAPCSAGHTGIMTIDEARQMAIDFAKLPELLKQNATAGMNARPGSETP